MRAAHLSPATIDVRCYHLRRLARETRRRTPWTVTTADLLAWMNAHRWGRETARSVRNSLRRFWAWAVATGQVKRNVADGLPPIAPPFSLPRPAAPAVVADAIEHGDARVVVMLRLANELGMRRGEVTVVHPRHDVVRDAAGWSLIVHGKGARNRILPLPDDLAALLRAAPDGYLFPGLTDGHLSPHWVGTLVSQALRDGTTMHQLRHLCATEIHDQTRDLRLVQTILGHASLATTQRYVAVNEATLRTALQARSTRWNGAG
jgi:integrase